MTIQLRPTVFRTALVIFALAAPGTAAAQNFISPLVGYDFGDDSRCPALRGCEDKNLNLGVGLGTMGPIAGVELDVSFAQGFFGDAPGYDSSVLTIMGNLLVGPEIGPVRPYGSGGVGLIKSHVSGFGGLLESTNNDFGWNLGGGVMIFVTQQVGVRGDLRHFHAFEDLEILGFPLSDTKLDFGRASAAVVFRF